ncbi:MAG: HipA domain-containing protein [Phormidesmis sp. FL-bin-119]|nr:HipA domain-containing protein [Pedobacter sp.]
MICKGCYRNSEEGYCRNCRKRLFNGKNVPTILTFGTPKDENLKQYQEKTKRLSISGVQLKYSLKLEGSQLVLTETKGEYILKPVPPTVEIEKSDQAPENEHLTMQIAGQIFDIDTADNALIYFSDGIPAYLTKRFDVKPDGRKYLQEDMAQLSGRTRQTNGENFKYEGNYEEIGKLISSNVAAAPPAIEGFFKVVLFNYLFSNGDAHLKNFSLIETDRGDHGLSKAYDLMSTILHTSGEYPTALELFKGDTEHEFFAKYGMYGQQVFRMLAEKLGIADIRIERILNQMLSSRPAVITMIEKSFLSEEAKKLYRSNYERRLEFMGMTDQMLIMAVDPLAKSTPTDRKFKLAFPRGVEKAGFFVNKLSKGRYLFLNADDNTEIEINAEELYSIVPL